MTEKTNIDDIIGIVKTEEKTNSVELKKEYYKNQSKRFKVKRWFDDNAIYDGEKLFAIVDVRNQANTIADRLNNQDQRIKELEQIIDTISKDYEESHGMDIRNAEWFTAW